MSKETYLYVKETHSYVNGMQWLLHSKYTGVLTFQNFIYLFLYRAQLSTARFATLLGKINKIFFSTGHNCVLPHPLRCWKK